MEREVTCSFCSHSQKTKSKLNQVTCSSCGRKIPINQIQNQAPKKIPDNNLERKEIPTPINNKGELAGPRVRLE